MPKPLNKKQKLTEKINQLEEELKQLDSLERFEDEPRKSSNRSKSSRHYDSDTSFDNEREAGSSKRSKDVGTRSKKPETKERDFKFSPSFRGKGRGGFIERGKIRGRGRGTLFRGSFKQFFRPKESSKSQESSKQKSQDLYNDGEDWSRYVSKNVERREKSGKDTFRDQEENFPDKPKSTSIEVMKSKPESLKAQKEDFKLDEKGQDDQDMFYFPPESKEDAIASDNKKNNEPKSTPDTKPDVMNLFQELQEKLASSGANISGIDLIADTLKKLGQIQNQTQGVLPLNQQKEETSKESPMVHSNTVEKKNSGVSFSISSVTKVVKPAGNEGNKTGPNTDPEMSSKRVNSRPIKQIEKVMMDDIKEQRKIYEIVENKSIPLKTISNKESGEKDISHHKQGSLPLYRKESVEYNKKDSLSPKHKGSNSPLRRRSSPSPLYRRRRSPSPLYRRRRESASPSHKMQESISPSHKRRESPSPSHKRRDSISSPPRGRESHTPPRRRESDTSPRRRDSKTPPRRRESNSPIRRRESKTPPRRRDSKTPPRYREMHSPSRRWRESEWFTRRSPKRRRSRSRSRSPRHHYRRRSSSFSPSRRYPYRKRRHTPSPDRRNPPHNHHLGSTWYGEKTPTYLSQAPDPLMQPKPPGGESSDVYAEVSFCYTFNLIVYSDVTRNLGKALDCVDHNILLGKLKYYGVSGHYLHFFQSYLLRRSHYVDTGKKQSNLLILK